MTVNKLKKAVKKIETKGFVHVKPTELDDQVGVIDKRMEDMKCFADLSYNLLRGERVRKSWMKDAEDNRFTRKESKQDN